MLTFLHYPSTTELVNWIPVMVNDVTETLPQYNLSHPKAHMKHRSNNSYPTRFFPLTVNWI